MTSHLYNHSYERQTDTHTHTQRERERERQTDRQRETETERQRDRERERSHQLPRAGWSSVSAADPRHGASYLGDSQSEKIRERQNQRERQRDRERQTERNRERQTETDRDDQRETESEREAERDRETEGPSYHAAPWPRVRVTSCRAECLECRRSISPLPEQPTCGRQRGREGGGGGER